MRINNPRNLPQAIVNAATQDSQTFDPTRISVTTLIAPSYIRKLTRLHWNELETDVEERANVIIGIALSEYLEKKACADDVAEKKIQIPFDGITLVGIPDLIHGTTLVDYKFAPVWSYIFGKDEWAQQVNIYAYMQRKLGHTIDNAEIIAFFGDWKWRDSMRIQDYPQYRIMRIPIKLLTDAEVEAFIMSRLYCHRNEVPCTPEERWSKPTTYAVMKEGRKTALRVLPSQEAAFKWCRENKLMENEEFLKKGHSVELRKGEDTRCLQYCSVAKFCDINIYNKGEGDGTRDDASD